MKVEIVFRVLPKSSEINVDTLIEKIKDKISPVKIEKEPIAFGLFAVKFSKIVEDKEGELEKVESKLKKIDEVGEYDVVSTTRLL
jgi:elongation factor 1-beta